MASKKSKVLAIAFCAAVMAGIHVNPVLAAVKPVDNGSVTVGYKDFDTTTGHVEDSKVTITNIASQDEVKQAQQTAEDAATLAGDALSTAKGVKDDLANETTARQEADNEIKADLAQETNDRIVADNQIKNDLKQETVDRIAGDNALNNAINKETVEREAADTLIKADLAQETNDRIVADNQIKNDLKQETVDRIAGDNALNNAINKETVEREAADTLIKADLAQETNDRIETDKQLQQSIDNHEEAMGVSNKTELEAAYDGATYIDKNDTMVEADRKLDAAISDVNTRVDGLENRVDGLEDRIDKVGAMSAAIANLRTMGYDHAAPTEVAVGVGQYRDETGMALGLFHYPNRDFMLSLSVSTSGDEYMGGIGATWKFGRKSPEKVAEIKKAQAEADARRAEEQKLAKAEEMKKAAKEAKVQAQMERHAKMLAEQEAQA